MASMVVARISWRFFGIEPDGIEQAHLFFQSGRTMPMTTTLRLGSWRWGPGKTSWS